MAPPLVASRSSGCCLERRRPGSLALGMRVAGWDDDSLVAPALGERGAVAHPRERQHEPGEVRGFGHDRRGGRLPWALRCFDRRYQHFPEPVAEDTVREVDSSEHGLACVIERCERELVVTDR